MLSVEREILDRLEEIDGVFVRSLAGLGRIGEKGQATPAVFLVYSGYGVDQNRVDGASSRITQTWLTVIAVRNVTSAEGQEAREDAGEIANRVFAKLAGFKPASAEGPLRLASAPPAEYADGFFYLPLAWEVQVVLP